MASDPTSNPRYWRDLAERARHAAQMADRGASVFKMRDVSRHKSMDVLQAYVRDADMFRDHAGAGLL
jgi:formate dehydrogenase assembly factor FdhD